MAGMRDGRIGAWLQLLRAPNLFTVPGDPLAGFLLALAGTAGASFPVERALAAAGASLMLYCAGLVHNDLCDFQEDCRERPTRPLPSGRISRSAAAIAYALFALGGVGLAWTNGKSSLTVAVILVLNIVAYNRYAKRIAVIGPLNMGLCRGLSVLVGASALGWSAVEHPAVIVGAAIVTAYIAAVTSIASRETAVQRVGARRNLPACILAFCFAFFILPGLHPLPNDLGAWAFVLLCGWGVVWAAWCAVRLGGTPAPRAVQQSIGRLIRGLLIVQAAFCCLCPWPGLPVAAILVAFWPLSWLVGRWFYAS